MNKRVIIVSDEQDFHNLYTDILKISDYKVVSVYSAVEARTKLREFKPDLIVFNIAFDMMGGDLHFMHIDGMTEYGNIPTILVGKYQKQSGNRKMIAR
ncbi:MAG: response regulator [Candidatus Scalindua sp. AMX11]|nr:MAG: response regulator [Candidatus Scalindua sp.]NOG85703.1 response regulator [Planctomycetota bacterium]RZV73154.1 MAG: response regulator [Candidatus Scalindua sp. SCAELEC01]TDE64758.1 MAG: response regulator [Candidatus Scalindua sp. AMX11]GJQ58677.1 MAG: hypothetical protein SCALA701_14780 [Candidatus Scalindua sp.]